MTPSGTSIVSVTPSYVTVAGWADRLTTRTLAGPPGGMMPPGPGGGTGVANVTVPPGGTLALAGIGSIWSAGGGDGIGACAAAVIVPDAMARTTATTTIQSGGTMFGGTR